MSPKYSMIAAIALFCPVLLAVDDKTSPDTSAAPAAKNKNCPVSGGAVKDHIYTDYKGERIYFCCKGCVSKFKGDPARYLAKAYQEMYPQRVQAVCPVMGGPVDPKISVEYKGKKVYLCCDDCIKEWNADPTKFLKKYEESFTDQVHDPVTGGPIVPEFSLDRDGKTIYFGSEASLEKFKAAPEKYKEALLPEMGVLARGATADKDIVLCPKCAGGAEQALRGEVKTAVHDGKVYFLCVRQCAEQFKADPAAYAASVAAVMKERGVKPTSGAQTTVVFDDQMEEK